ncbi:hypothetical protein [Xylophilus ampelinus]|uniref:HEAT repeat domain-containing protein n=1 Tax=Xylophilus ampelinus TaxID=54067 RepID=A0A318SGC2_9BURK|nr:hypothetical protein [Xylophilus ampelinus]MCS4510420.1 hypothetical protein [Xylophilus ampelinus]PYE77874.1 hypothetical protein DFQ15_11118 [Xylophilus ampelinus]
MELNFTNLYRNLMAVGLLGLVYREMEDGNEICSLVEYTLAEPLQFQVCRAVVSGISGATDVAKGSLSEYVNQNPNDEPAHLALAISLLLAGDADGKRAIERLLATTENTAVRDTANNMLELLERQPELVS